MTRQPVMSWAASVGASALATLNRPGWWVMALAGFLVRGGLVVILLPIVRLPTTAGLAHDFGPIVVGFVFNGPSAASLVLVGTVAAAVFAWFVLGGVVGGRLDLELVREAAADEDLEGLHPPIAGGPAGAFFARVIAHGPTFAVVAVGAVRLVDAVYQELVRPGDAVLPIAVRVLLRIPEIVGLLVGTWLLGEAVGGLAVRHLAWGAGLPRSLARGVRAVLRPPALALLLVTNAVLGAVILAVAGVIGIGWDHLRLVLADGGSAGEVRLALLVFALTWAAGLWLLALAVAWRATAWTFEVARILGAEASPDPAGGPGPEEAGAIAERSILAP
ncbi:MAG: hypothetical protein HW391_1468 [Chloroflexi bacterium]|nr:hypothetical protein [Chloroflexota bacterium]